MSESVSHPQITKNTKLIEINDTISVDRMEQRETNEQTEKSSSSHLDTENTEEPKRKPFSHKLNAYLKDMTTRETTKTTTSQRLTSRQQQRKKSHDDNTINTRQSRQRHYDLSSASSIGSIENGPDDSTDDGVHRQKKFKGNTHEELLTDESRQDTSTSLHQGKPRTGKTRKMD
jgi:hypothetical protein